VVAVLASSGASPLPHLTAFQRWNPIKCGRELAPDRRDTVSVTPPASSPAGNAVLNKITSMPKLEMPSNVGGSLLPIGEKMYQLARDLEFEAAAQTRDEIGKLRERLLAV
jgi:hypothetical protein